VTRGWGSGVPEPSGGLGVGHVSGQAVLNHLFRAQKSIEQAAGVIPVIAFEEELLDAIRHECDLVREALRAVENALGGEGS
jgi:hypothetical protein